MDEVEALELRVEGLLERNRDLTRDVQIWQTNFNAAIALLAIFKEPDWIEMVDEAAQKRWLPE